MNFLIIPVLVSACCSLFIQNVAADKILGVFAFPGQSHSMMLLPVMKELALRGHEVTVISNYPINERIINYTEILIEPVFDYWKNVQVDSLFDLTEMKFGEMMNFLYNTIGVATTEHALKNEKVQEFLQRTDNKFDLIIAEQFYQEAFLILAHKYNAPIVTIATFGFAQYMSPLFGVLSPWSHVPHEFLPYSDRMSYFERLHSSMLSLYEHYLRQCQYLPNQDRLAKEYFSHLPGVLPSVKQLEKNISVILLNSHVTLTTPRPVITGMVQVGGLHIKKIPTLLPYDVKDFLDGARHGVIYFSMGTNFKSSDLPPEKLEMFIKIFSALKQRVLWKIETNAKFPKNVMIKKWMPQSDILAHPHVKVFITHGGHLGTQEGVYRAVPMLGIPILIEQQLNMKKANADGYAILLSFKNITEASLKWALHELLHNPQYVQKVRHMSKMFRDRPMNPMDESIYWIEYVSKHKGATHIRSAALDMSWFSFMLLDIVAFFVLSILGVFAGAYGIILLIQRYKKTQKGKMDNKKII